MFFTDRPFWLKILLKNAMSVSQSRFSTLYQFEPNNNALDAYAKYVNTRRALLESYRRYQNGIWGPDFLLKLLNLKSRENRFDLEC
jgi:hypothetical protein